VNRTGVKRKMRRSVSRSASTGRFVKSTTVRRHPKTTVTQTTGGKGHGYRSAITGRFVSKATARRHPETTIHEGGA
jgi:hypothetical protein